MRSALVVIALLFTLSLLSAEPIKSAEGDDLAQVDANGNLRVSWGPSALETYSFTTSTSTTAYGHTDSHYGPPKVIEVCVRQAQQVGATVASMVVVTRFCCPSVWVDTSQEETTGALIALSTFDKKGPNAPFMVPSTGDGVQGTMLDQWGFTPAEQGAGTADFPATMPICMKYGGNGTKAIVLSPLSDGVLYAQTAVPAIQPISGRVLVGGN